MLSCCFGITGGSDLKKDKSGGHGGAWRRRVYSWLQPLWPFGRKETNLSQGSQGQDHTDQVTTLKCQLSQISLLVFGTIMIGSGKLGVIIANHNIAVLCLFEPSTWLSLQLEKESAPKDPKESGRTPPPYNGLGEVVHHSVTSV